MPLVGENPDIAGSGWKATVLVAVPIALVTEIGACTALGPEGPMRLAQSDLLNGVVDRRIEIAR